MTELAEPTEPKSYDRDPRIRTTPRFAIVRSYHDGSGIVGVYGVYKTEQFAKLVMKDLAEFGIDHRLEIVPFYEVTT